MPKISKKHRKRMIINIEVAEEAIFEAQELLEVYS